MPKLTGMATVSTKDRVAPEGKYELLISEIEDTKSKAKKSKMLVVTTQITDNDEDVAGIQMRTYCVYEDAKGEAMEGGLRRMKKIVEQTLGEEAANDPEFDTDELKGWRGEGLVGIEEYEDENEPDPEKKTKQRNYVKRYFTA